MQAVSSATKHKLALDEELSKVKVANESAQADISKVRAYVVAAASAGCSSAWHRGAPH